MRSTIREVAERANVSAVTVTNVLRGKHGRASQDTRQRVLKAAHELNYVPVAQPASQQRQIETHVIGVVFDQIELEHHYAALHAYLGLRDTALKHNYDLLMVLRDRPDWAPGRDEIQFLDRRADGYIFVSPLERHRVFHSLVEQNVPVVACFSPDVPEGVGWTTSDNEDVVRQGLEHLVELGHRKIAFLNGPRHNLDIRQRRKRFRELAARAGQGVEGQCFGDEDAGAPDAEAARDMLQWGATAVLCSHDGYALQLWRLLEQHGLRVPQDMSLVGIDDAPDAATAGLTTVRVDGRAIAAAAVDSWIALRHGADFLEQRKVFPGQLIVRSSTAELKS